MGLTQSWGNRCCQNQQVGCEQREVRQQAERSADGAEEARMAEHKGWACPIHGSHESPRLGWGQVPPPVAAAKSQASAHLPSQTLGGLTSLKDLPVHLISSKDGETVFCEKLWVLRRTILPYPLSEACRSLTKWNAAF